MKSIKNNISNTYIINKSKFICCIYRVDSLEKIDYYLSNIKSEYKDATHYCYAYILDGVKRFSDDSEPGGTAGMPILNVLDNNFLEHVLCIVVRYFGGIKLGAGGLVRAYTKSVTEALDKTIITNLIDGYRLTIEFNYDDTKMIDNIIRNCNIISKEFDDKVRYVIELCMDEYINIKDSLNIINISNILLTEV